MSDCPQAGNWLECPIHHCKWYDNGDTGKQCPVCLWEIRDSLGDDWKQIEKDLRDLDFSEKRDNEQDFSSKQTSKLLIPCPLCDTPLLKKEEGYTCSGCDTEWNTDDLAEALGDNNFFIEE